MSIDQIAVPVVGLVALLTAVGWLTQRLWRVIRLSVHAFETIQKELSPNGGGSTHDIVRQLKVQADLHELRLDEIGTEAKQATASAGQAAERADLAATAAGQAVDEAKTARAAMTESDRRTSERIATTQGAVESLERGLANYNALAEMKEVAYVAALRSLGVDLVPIAAALDEPAPNHGGTTP
jgi:hypothetical protein